MARSNGRWNAIGLRWPNSFVARLQEMSCIGDAQTLEIPLLSPDHGDCPGLRVLRSRFCVSARLEFHHAFTQSVIDPRRWSFQPGATVRRASQSRDGERLDPMK